MIISAPSADAPMFVMGVNHEKYSSDMKGKHRDLYHDYQVPLDVLHSVVNKCRKWKKSVV